MSRAAQIEAMIKAWVNENDRVSLAQRLAGLRDAVYPLIESEVRERVALKIEGLAQPWRSVGGGIIVHPETYKKVVEMMAIHKECAAIARGTISA
jgi:hypothetical protein